MYMDYQALKKHRNDHNPFTRKLGITVEEISAGYARVTKTIGPDDLNPVDLPHGGVYFTMADNACGSAMSSHGHMAVTVSANYNFFRGAQVGDTLTAEAREVKTGRTICVYEVQITDQNGTLLGSGSFTFYKLEQEIQL
jgi:acyl-CoA thioesterase